MDLEVTEALRELTMADELQSASNYWRRSAMTRLSIWAGQPQQQLADKSLTPGSDQAPPTTQIEQTSNNNANNDDGKKP